MHDLIWLLYTGHTELPLVPTTFVGKAGGLVARRIFDLALINYAPAQKVKDKLDTMVRRFELLAARKSLAAMVEGKREVLAKYLHK